jgi:hypothetical protein
MRGHRAVLVAFMSYHDSVECEKDAEFSVEELFVITAEDICRWFNHRACGKDVPLPNDRPIHARSTSLHHWKKCLSCFFPNRNHQWNELTGTGNPTKSQLLNDLINKVKKFEVRGEGSPSKARRALKEPEFRSIVQQLRSQEDIESKCGIPALLCFQFHMIGRIDDCCKWKRENLATHDVHPDKCGKARMAWSKNATDERAAPWQHLFGCMDPICCVLLGLGLWLEVFHSSTPNGRVRPMVFRFSDKCIDNAEEAGDHGKAIVGQLLRPFFLELGAQVEDDNVGSHSVRKRASTWARSNGTSKDDKDHRGR